jgi:hypothetical protein
MDVPMELSRVLITELGDQQVIFLREIDGDRGFPIMIGTYEAMAIDRRLKGIPAPRPMTHDLLANVIEALGASVDRIVISDLSDHTFIATLYLSTLGGEVAIDSRPSDAIAIGAAMDTPIYVAQKVLDDIANPPTTKHDRLELLRQRLAVLGDRIAEFNQRLGDKGFLAQAPDEVVSEHRRQLRDMQTEYEAIEGVLKKWG